MTIHIEDPIQVVPGTDTNLDTHEFLFKLPVLTRFTQLLGLRLLCPEWLDALIEGFPVSFADKIEIRQQLLSHIDSWLTFNGIGGLKQASKALLESPWTKLRLAMTDSVNIVPIGQHQGHLPGYLFHNKAEFTLRLDTAVKLIGLRLLGRESFQDALMLADHTSPGRTRLANSVQGWLWEHGILDDDALPNLPSQSVPATPLRGFSQRLQNQLVTPANAKAAKGQLLWSPDPRSTTHLTLPTITPLNLVPSGVDLEIKAMECLTQLYRKNAYVQIVEIEEFVQELVRLENMPLGSDWKRQLSVVLSQLVSKGFVKHYQHVNFSDSFCISDKTRAGLKKILLQHADLKAWDSIVLFKVLGKEPADAIDTIDVNNKPATMELSQEDEHATPPMESSVDTDPELDLTTPVLEGLNEEFESPEATPSIESSSSEEIHEVDLRKLVLQTRDLTSAKEVVPSWSAENIEALPKKTSKKRLYALLMSLAGGIFAREHLLSGLDVVELQDRLHPSIAQIVAHAHHHLPSVKNTNIVEKAANLVVDEWKDAVNVHVKRVVHHGSKHAALLKGHALVVKDHGQQAWIRVQESITGTETWTKLGEKVEEAKDLLFGVDI
jgi:hypothetical protein